MRKQDPITRKCLHPKQKRITQQKKNWLHKQRKSLGQVQLDVVNEEAAEEVEEEDEAEEVKADINRMQQQQDTFGKRL